MHASHMSIGPPSIPGHLQVVRRVERSSSPKIPGHNHQVGKHVERSSIPSRTRIFDRIHRHTSIDVCTPEVRFSTPRDLQHKWKFVKYMMKLKGFVVLQGPDSSPTTLKQVAEMFGPIQRHSRNTATGIVDITSEEYSSDEKTKKVASNIKFLPHTDGTYLNGIALSKKDKCVRVGPPRFVLLQCVKPAKVGGVSLVVDAQKILTSLVYNDPDLIPALFSPYGLTVKRGDYCAVDVPVFRKMNNRRYAIRFSYDRDFQFPKIYRAAFEKFYTKYNLDDAFTFRHALSANQIMVMDNQRVLHARTEFIGERLMRRVWIHNNEELQTDDNDQDVYLTPYTTKNQDNPYEAFTKLELSENVPKVDYIPTGITIPGVLSQRIKMILFKSY